MRTKRLNKRGTSAALVGTATSELLCLFRMAVWRRYARDVSPQLASMSLTEGRRWRRQPSKNETWPAEYAFTHLSFFFFFYFPRPNVTRCLPGDRMWSVGGISGGTGGRTGENKPCILFLWFSHIRTRRRASFTSGYTRLFSKVSPRRYGQRNIGNRCADESRKFTVSVFLEILRRPFACRSTTVFPSLSALHASCLDVDATGC